LFFFYQIRMKLPKRGRRPYPATQAVMALGAGVGERMEGPILVAVVSLMEVGF
jgi:hypothetical protein